MELRLSANLFTKAYRRYRAAIGLGSRYVVFFGAADSSKSYSSHQDLVLDLMTAKDDILVIRKQASHIEQSCYKLLKTIIATWGISHDFEFFYSGSKREIVYKKTGKKIVFSGVNDPESLKSIFGFYRLLIEEANQLDWEDFLELDRRLRSNQKIQIIMLLNPVSETHWIKAKLIDGAAYAGQVETLKVTYHDNDFITPERVAALERLKDVSEYDYQVYVLGDWGIIGPENPYWEAFKPDKHLATGLTYNPALPVYLSFDFNITNSVLARQKPTVRGLPAIHFFKEWHQHGVDLEGVCEQLALSFPRNQLLLTGDASGRAGSAYTTGNKSAWQLIVNFLSKYGARYVNIDAVPLSNPSHTSSRFMVNALTNHYTKNAGGFLIDRDGCPTFVTDLKQVATSSDGGLNKDEANRKNIGHVLDCGRYDLCNFEYTTFKRLGLP